MNDRKLDPSRFKFEPNRYRECKMQNTEPLLLSNNEEIIIIDPDNFDEEPIKPFWEKEVKANELDRLIASTRILDAVIKELGGGGWVFMNYCQNCSNLSEAVISAYNKLTYRERSMMAMKLGFEERTFQPKKKLPYNAICYKFELFCPDSVSRVVRKAYRKIFEEMIIGSRGEGI